MHAAPRPRTPDVDLVILTQQPHELLIERNWVRSFGEPITESLEDYGLLKSIRVRYIDLEVEFGIASITWPLDVGSRQVIDDGMQVLFERGSVLSGPCDTAKPHTKWS